MPEKTVLTVDQFNERFHVTYQKQLTNRLIQGKSGNIGVGEGERLAFTDFTIVCRETGYVYYEAEEEVLDIFAEIKEFCADGNIELIPNPPTPLTEEEEQERDIIEKFARRCMETGETAQVAPDFNDQEDAWWYTVIVNSERVASFEKGIDAERLMDAIHERADDIALERRMKQKPAAALSSPSMQQGNMPT